MEDYQDEIDQYIMDALNAEDRKKFEQRLVAEPALREELQIRRDMQASAEVYGRQELKKKLQVMHQEIFGQSSAPAQPREARRLWPYIAAAASILLLIAAVFLFKSPSSTQTPQALYAEYFTPYDISGLQRSGNNEQILIMQEHYRNGNYIQALPALEKLLVDTNPQPSHWLLAAGICQLELKKPDEAYTFFNQIRINQDFNFQNEVSWYLALTRLQQNDVQSVRLELQSLANDPQADHHREALELLDKLNN